MVKSLETERLILRRWVATDLHPFSALNADANVMQHFPRILTVDETRGFIASAESSFEREGFGLWATQLKESGEFIGFVGLSVPRFEAHFTPCVEIGWRLAHEFWGRGYAPEASLTVLNDAFERLGLLQVVSFTARVNTNSIRVMQKIGMKSDPQEDFDHPYLPAGHRLQRHVLYRMSAVDWMSVQNR